MYEMMLPAVKEIIRLRTMLDEATRDYLPKRDAFIAERVAQYLGRKASLPPHEFRAWLRDIVMDAQLEDDIWQAVLPHLTPADFQGWYMLLRNGEPNEAFKAADTRAAGRHVAHIRRYVKDKTITWAYVPLAQAMLPAA
jgi:hypothetical protein